MSSYISSKNIKIVTIASQGRPQCKVISTHVDVLTNKLVSNTFYRWNFVKSDGGSTKGRPVNHTLNADSERDDIVILKFAYSR